MVPTARDRQLALLFFALVLDLECRLAWRCGNAMERPGRSSGVSGKTFCPG
ncbi:MAG: hypothetical protein NTY67_12275 [Cyanobacteria bacterium]|nr:hypothetical protein [Cyanobacteriota bacterium]